MTTSSSTTAKQRRIQLSTPLLSRFAGILFFSAVAWALYRGWQLRDEHYLIAEKGTGYALGIIGGLLMLLLLLYPLRKHWRPIRNWGPIRYWFRIHMVFGVLGPTLILFHANFGLGSLNSNVALFCMLLVAGSGIFGRFFYTRIHYGLYGSKASLQELSDIASDSRSQLAWLNSADEEFSTHIRSIETTVMDTETGLVHSFFRWLKYTSTAWWHYWRLRRLAAAAIGRSAATENWDNAQQRLQRRNTKKYLRTYFSAARRVLEFNFYEQLFALWHVIHLPFFFMMLLSGVIHVIAVHMY
ncbi:MAG: transcriptional regulator [Gammaproteobacteria bacterium]|nr:transcriptional regulator [Gammaproteobacteria bacterium]